MGRSSFGGTVKLTGESEYQKALTGITNNLKVLNSEMKIVTAQYDKNDKSVSNLTQQNTVLNKKIEEQNEKVKVLEKALEDAKNETGENSETTKKWQTELNNAQAELKKLEKSVSDNEQAMDEFGEETEESGESVSRLGELIKANLISDAIKAGFKGLVSVIKSVGSAFVDVGKQAIASYGEYEQLVGGVDTLFKESSAKVQEYASIAYRTAGLSANEYMETVTSFSASLLQSLEGDTAESARIADMAITDMSDNANKMGTSMESIQNAYQGFAKQNYTMLDNLKLGYGGTATEMARLVNESGVLGDAMIDLSKTNEITSQLQEVGYAKIIEAIHKVQQEMGITGTTADEAGRTITGSTGSMRAAWQNLLTGIADDNADFEQLVNNLVVSIVGENGEGGVLNNILPRIETALDGIVKMVGSLTSDLLPEIMQIGVDLITNLATSITENLPSLMESARTILETVINGIVSLLPTLIPIAVQMIKTLVQGLISAVPQLLSVGGELIDMLTEGLQGNVPTFISKALDVIEGFADFLTENVPILLEKGIEMIATLVQGIMEALPELIARVPEIISKFANVINDNAPTIIKAGIGIIGNIITGLLKAIPTLVANIPKIIKAMIDVWEAVNWVNLGKNAIEFVGNGIKSMLSFVKTSMTSIKDGAISMIKNLPQNLWDIGKNAITNLGGAISNMKSTVVNTVKTVASNMISSLQSTLSWSNLKSIGQNLIQGLWNGISDMAGWVINKIYGFGDSVLSALKSFFGIASPSKVFKEEIGKNLALGVGVGFADTMANVSTDMQNAIPTEFDADVHTSFNGNTRQTSSPNYNMMVSAFKEALTEVKVVMNNREMGNFVTDTIERVVYA